MDTSSKNALIVNKHDSGQKNKEQHGKIYLRKQPTTNTYMIMFLIGITYQNEKKVSAKVEYNIVVDDCQFKYAGEPRRRNSANYAT